MWGMKNLARSLTMAAITGAVELSRPADWSPAWRRAYVWLPGAAIGAISAVAVQAGLRKGRELAAAGTVDLVTPNTPGRDGAAAVPAAGPVAGSSAGPVAGPAYLATSAPGPRSRKPAIALTGLAVVAGAAVSGIMALTLVLDERMEAWLVRRGAARPRMVMAVAGALSSLALDVLADAKDTKASRQAPDQDSQDPAPAQ